MKLQLLVHCREEPVLIHARVKRALVDRDFCASTTSGKVRQIEFV